MALAIAVAVPSLSFQTTVLLTVEDKLAALEKAQSVQYRPPGA